MELLRGDRDLVRVGHRGAAALAAENSLAAIEAAVAHGIDVVELDVLEGASGELVLAHGPEVPAAAPLLDDGLALVAELGVGVLIDVKISGFEAGVVAAIRRHGLFDRSFVSSFSLEILRRFAAVEPALPRSLTYPEDRHGVSDRPLLAPVLRPTLAVLRTLLPARLPRWLHASGARAATLNAAVVSPRAVEVCHRLDVAVYAWTVDEAALATSLVETGIDGIITNDPRILPTGLPSRS
jgi:glycerophosphoryl diester phosphodiesterase